jgi:hypothetical protein
LAARVRCLLLWVGEGGVRLYAAGQPGGARSDKLLYQAGLALDPRLRLKVVRKMYAMRFDEEPPTSVVGEPFCYPADHAPKDPRAGHHRPPGGGVRWVDRVAGGDELHYRIGGDDGFRDVAVRLD